MATVIINITVKCGDQIVTICMSFSSDPSFLKGGKRARIVWFSQWPAPVGPLVIAVGNGMVYSAPSLNRAASHLKWEQTNETQTCPVMEITMTAVENRPANPVAVVIPAALGLLFCALNAAGAKLLCVSSGCDIYADYTLGGLSINLLGAVFFALLLLLALLAPRQPLFRRGLWAVLVAGLLVDALFLLWQIFYWPCVSCLVVAVLLALCVLGALLAWPTLRGKIVYLALLLWFAAFMPVAAVAGKELLLQPWPALGAADAPVAVYFSPTCPACEKTVADILALPELTGQVAFFPIAKNAEDLQRLAQVLGGEGEADLMALFAPVNELPAAPDLSLRWRLARNKMSLARLGGGSVPLVLTPRLVQAMPVVPQTFPQTFPQSGGSYLDFGVSPIEEGCSMAAPAGEVCE